MLVLKVIESIAVCALSVNTLTLGSFNNFNLCDDGRTPDVHSLKSHLIRPWR